METPRHPVGDTAGPWGHAPWGPPGDTWTPLGAQCQSLGSDPMGTPRHPTGATANPPSFPPPPPPHGDTRPLLGTPKHPLGTLPAPGVTQPWGHLGPPPHSQPVLPLRMSKSPSVSPPPGGARIPLWVPPPPLGTPPMCLQCPTAALPPLYKPLPCKYRTMYIAAAAGGGDGDTATQGHREGAPIHPLPPPRPPLAPSFIFFPFLFALSGLFLYINSYKRRIRRSPSPSAPTVAVSPL